jgi:peptide deformylase
MEAEDFIARIIQHEVDHLEGRLCFLFTKETIEDLASEKVWKRIIAEKK